MKNLKEQCAAAEADKVQMQREIGDREDAANKRVREAENKALMAEKKADQIQSEADQIRSEADCQINSMCKFVLISWIVAILMMVSFGILAL